MNYHAERRADLLSALAEKWNRLMADPARYPKMVYKAGGEWLIVNDEDEHATANQEGWADHPSGPFGTGRRRRTQAAATEATEEENA